MSGTGGQRFAGKAALVTGAGQGLGEAYARALAAEGAAVAILDLSGASAEKVAADITAAGGRAVSAAADVTDPDAVAAAVAQVVDAFGGLDILVNNAGMHLGRASETTTLEPELWRRVLDVNVVGTLICATAVRRALAARGGGVIINISSMAAYSPRGGAYGVSKLAVNGLTMSLAAELSADGTRVVAVAPGMIGTEAVLDHLAPQHKDLVTAGQLVKRFGQPADIVGLVLFLASDEASFITAQTFLADGGFTPKP